MPSAPQSWAIFAAVTNCSIVFSTYSSSITSPPKPGSGFTHTLRENSGWLSSPECVSCHTNSALGLTFRISAVSFVSDFRFLGMTESWNLRLRDSYWTVMASRSMRPAPPSNRFLYLRYVRSVGFPSSSESQHSMALMTNLFGAVRLPILMGWNTGSFAFIPSPPPWCGSLHYAAGQGEMKYQT